MTSHVVQRSWVFWPVLGVNWLTRGEALDLEIEQNVCVNSARDSNLIQCGEVILLFFLCHGNHFSLLILIRLLMT